MTIRITAVLAVLLLTPPVAFSQNSLKKFTDALNALSKPGAAANNLIVNGNFEEPVVQAGGYSVASTGQSIPGWQVTGVGRVSPISGDYAQSGIKFNAEQGRQWLDLTGDMSNSATGVQQSVQTQPGATYELVFYVGNVTGGVFGTKSEVEVLVDGKSLGVARNDKTNPGHQLWGQFRKTFTAAGETTAIAFMNRDPASDNSNGLDNVTLTLVTPGSAPAAAAAGGAVLTDDFETPATNNYTVYKAGQSFATGGHTWTVQSGSIDLVNAQVRTETVAYDGRQLVDLAGSPGPGVMMTDFTTVAGKPYTLIFHYARNSGLGRNVARAQVDVTSATPLLHAEIQHDPNLPFSAQQTYTGTFTADGPRATLRFTSLNAGNFGLTIDGISVTQAAVSAASNLPDVAGDYVYLGKGQATFTQTGDLVHGFSTWPPVGAGPHYEFKGKIVGNKITGEWYSLYAQKGWYRWAAQILPNGDLDFSQSDDPIKSNMNKSYLTKKH